MRYLASYMLCVMGGNPNPTYDDIHAILSSVGIDCDTERVNIVINRLKGQSITDLIEKGQSLLASMTVVEKNNTPTRQTDITDQVKDEKIDDAKPETDDSDDDIGGMMDLFDL